MPALVQVPVEGKTATYKGVYRPHWEIAHIAVRVPRVRFSLRSLTFPAFVVLAAPALFLSGLLKPSDTCVILALYGGLEVILRLIPNVERWAPHFPPGCDVGPDEGGGPIEFEGIVSPPGAYGHKGSMTRKVEIVRVLRYKNCQQKHGEKG